MSTYEESYSNTTTDLEYFVPDIQAFDRKIVITNWQTYASNIYLAGSTGTMDEVFRDNVNLGSAESALSDLTEDGEWFYDSTNDNLYLYSSSNPITNHTIEGGRSFSTLKTLAVARGAEFIRQYINRPIHKRAGVGTQGISGESYDDGIIKSNSALACADIVRPYDPDRADYLQNLAYNAENNGMLDKIKSGEVSLWHDKTMRHNQGIVRRKSVNSNTTANIIDVRGQATADDLILVKITSGGTFTKGTANTSITYSVFTGDDTGLQVKEVLSNEIIDGDFQTCAHGLKIQFSTGVLTTNDEWEIECSGTTPEAGSPVKSITLERA